MGGWDSYRTFGFHRDVGLGRLFGSSPMIARACGTCARFIISRLKPVAYLLPRYCRCIRGLVFCAPSCHPVLSCPVHGSQFSPPIFPHATSGIFSPPCSPFFFFFRASPTRHLPALLHHHIGAAAASNIFSPSSHHIGRRSAWRFGRACTVTRLHKYGRREVRLGRGRSGRNIGDTRGLV
jgi:hypothetical protein